MYSLVSPDQSITEISLEDLLKQSSKTLLYFYPKDNTPGCTLEAIDFSQRIEEFAALWVQIVWVSKDSADSHCGFIANHGLKPFYLSDPEMILHKQFGAYGEKNNYGKIVTGVIRSTFLLDQQGEILQERKNVRATWHAERILKELHK